VSRAAKPVAETRVFYDGAYVDAGIYDRDKLVAGEWFAGPAIVRQSDCTTCLVGGFKAAHSPRRWAKGCTRTPGAKTRLYPIANTRLLRSRDPDHAC
jgi:hypothetical protein